MEDLQGKLLSDGNECRIPVGILETCSIWVENSTDIVKLIVFSLCVPDKPWVLVPEGE